MWVLDKGRTIADIGCKPKGIIIVTFKNLSRQVKENNILMVADKNPQLRNGTSQTIESLV